MNYGLTDTHWKSVHKALADIPGIERAQLFGSRAMGTFSPTSDVDMVLYGDNLTLQQEFKLTAVLNEIDPLLEFDLLRFKTITSKALLEHIEKYGVTVYEGGRESEKSRIHPRQGRREECAWTYHKLGECADFLSGGTPSKANSSYWKGVIPWVSAKDMKTFRLYDAEDHISQEAADNGTRLVPSDSILLLVRGMTLHNDIPVCYTKRDMAFNQDIKALRAKDSIEPLFLAYWLLAHKPKLLNIVEFAGHGTGRIPTDILKNLDMYLPPLPEQRAIAHILGILDDKIELNRKMNETLEVMAHAIFKSWFVDFDPVRAKAEGREPVGMDTETAALFPDSFEDSELGEIPRGWNCLRISDIASIQKGLSYKGEFLSPSEGQPMVNLGCFSGQGKFMIDKLKYYMGDFKEHHKVLSGDIVLANTDITQKREILGSPAILPIFNKSDCFIYTHHVFALRLGKNWLGKESFLYFNLMQPTFRERAIGYATGTTVLALPADAVLDYFIVFPDNKLLNVFVDLIKTKLKKVYNNSYQSYKLSQIRDTLLPKLLSGELNVKVAEKEIESLT